MVQTATAPTFFDRHAVFRGAYAPRLQDFTEAGQRAGFAPAQSDAEKIAVVMVDYQHDFVEPTGTLYVPGSQQDVARFLTWFYTNAHKITSIYASLDTHLPSKSSIAHGGKIRNRARSTALYCHTLDDVTNRWVPIFQPDWSRHYVQQLQQRAKKDLMIWPYHTMEGTLGICW